MSHARKLVLVFLLGLSVCVIVSNRLERQAYRGEAPYATFEMISASETNINLEMSRRYGSNWLHEIRTNDVMLRDAQRLVRTN